MYLESIIRLVKRKVYKDSILIFCLDAPQESLWRKELMVCYKGKRTDLSKKNNFKPTFKLTYNEIIPEFSGSSQSTKRDSELLPDHEDENLPF